MGGGNNGWLTTKKRGRDDSQIARDRDSALRNKTKKKQSLTVPKKKKTKSQQLWSEEDSLDDFVVPDDESIEEDYDDDDEEEEEELELEAKPSYFPKKSTAAPKHRSTAAAKKKPNKPEVVAIIDSSSEDDDDDPFSTTLPSTKAKPAANKSSKNVSAAWDNDSSSDDDLLRNHSKNPTTSSFFEKSSNKKAFKKPNLSQKSDGFWRALEDSDDESPQKAPPKKKKPKKTPAVLEIDDVVEDPDEAVALAWALSESRKQSKKSTAAAPPAAKKQQHALVDSDEESAQQEEEEDEQEDYVNEDAKEAVTILEAANQLSAQVLTSMKQWTNASTASSSSNSNTESGVPLGMIDDGALTLSHVDQKSTTDHTWISHDDMKEILPTVKFADYQLIGVNWMALLHGMQCRVGSASNNGKGKSSKRTNVNGILADEMGLGKTVQTIGFLSWLKHTREKQLSGTSGATDDVVDLTRSDSNHSVSAPHRPHLVVAPSSVLSNWLREFEKFAPQLRVVKYHGLMAEREELREDLRIHLPNNWKARQKHGVEPIDVILTPVTYFQSEKGDDRSFLRKFHYDYLVVDEAHLLKNAKGRRYKSLNAMRTEHRLLLTGTPVQNAPKELLCLLCFLMPLFSKKGNSFDDHGNDGGESMLQHFVSAKGGGSKMDDEGAYRKLKQLFAPFVLRRRKVEVLSQLMPPKTRRLETVELNPQARQLYDSTIASHIESKKTGSRQTSDHLFTQLRKCAHHPLLIRSRYTAAREKEHLAKWFHRFGAFRGDSCTLDKVRQELEGYNDFEIHLTALDLIEENAARRTEIGRYVLEADDLLSSAKCKRLKTLLPELVANGHRVLLFSNWTSCLDVLSCLLEQLDMRYLRMEGSTPVQDRQALIDKFTDEPDIPVFLLSTRACGLGINLTCADVCIVHDLDFNPFNDLQAEDRCHRIGQTKPVTIVKMVTQDTVDEDIYNMQQRKARMNAAIMGQSDADKKEMAREKKQVLDQAVNRYLKSPSCKGRPRGCDKENEKNPADSARV